MADQITGGCDISAGIGDGQVDIGGVVTTPGSDGGGGSGESITSTGVSEGDPRCIYKLQGRCFARGPAKPVPGDPVVVKPITLVDIASFRPDPGIDNMEPNGWMIVGLDTNFYANVGTHVKDGTLLGLPASVRFTPVAWHWAYGDGNSATLATRGNTWAAQGIREFDSTPTSHVYRQPGTYYIDLTIDFSAEYTVAGIPWTRIAGTLPVPANRLVATAGGAKTVLVERECTAHPRGPGC